MKACRGFFLGGRRFSGDVKVGAERLDNVAATIKGALNIVDVVGQYLRLEPAGSKFKALCPFHDDHKPSFMVDPNYQSYKCWVCDAHGDVISFVQNMERLDFRETVTRLAERAGITLPGNWTNQTGRGKTLYRILAWAQEHFENCLHHATTGADARQYLQGRGFTEQTWRRFGLGYTLDRFDALTTQAKNEGITESELLSAGLAKKRRENTGVYDVFRGRVTFPIRDERGRVLAFGGRILPELASDEGQPKYLNSPASNVYNKSHVLFGLDVVSRAMREGVGPDGTPAGEGASNEKASHRSAAKRASSIWVMEGYTDCLMTWQQGWPWAVATCGTALTKAHVAKLRTYTDNVVLMFDGDQAGVRAAEQATQLFLEAELDLRLCVLPDNLDPCDFVHREGTAPLRELANQAPDAIDYHLKRAMGSDGADSLENRRRAVNSVLDVLAALPAVARAQQSVKVELALSRLRQWAGVDENTLRRELTRIRQQKNQRAPAARAPQPGPPSSHQTMPTPTGEPSMPPSALAASSQSASLPSQAGSSGPSSQGNGSEPTSARASEPPMPTGAGPTHRVGPGLASLSGLAWQRQVVQWLLAVPSRAGEFRLLVPADSVSNPDWQQLLDLCYRLHDQFGAELSLDHLREGLNDPRLQSTLFALTEDVLASGQADRGLDEIKAVLERRQRAQARQQAVQHIGPDQDDHLNLLRQLRDQNAL